MTQHHIATIDCGWLRIYEETDAFEPSGSRLALVEAMDFPGLIIGDGDSESFPRNLDIQPANSTDQRTAPELRSKRQRDVNENTGILAAELDTFLQNRPEASWVFPAPPSLYRGVLESMSEGTRSRLKCALSTAMVSNRAEDVREQFAAALR